MKYFVTVDGEEHEVELTERLGQLLVRLDGEALDVHYREVDALGQVALFIGDEGYGVSIEGDTQLALVTVAGREYHVEIEDERERAAHQVEREHGHAAAVKSVMPGIVADVLVAEGATVEKGQPLLILEAMKMQNEIDAPISGRVSRVHVAKGQTVGSGELLVHLEAEPQE